MHRNTKTLWTYYALKKNPSEYLSFVSCCCLLFKKLLISFIGYRFADSISLQRRAARALNRRTWNLVKIILPGLGRSLGWRMLWITYEASSFATSVPKITYRHPMMLTSKVRKILINDCIETNTLSPRSRVIYISAPIFSGNCNSSHLAFVAHSSFVVSRH